MKLMYVSMCTVCRFLSEEILFQDCFIIIIIISLFKEDYILSKLTYLTYGPL